MRQFDSTLEAWLPVEVPYTINPKTYTLNPYTLNPKTYTLDCPAPYTLKAAPQLQTI